MDVPRENIDMPPLEWKPEQADGHLKPEEYQTLQKLVSRFYDQIAKSVRPEPFKRSSGCPMSSTLAPCRWIG